MKSETDELRNLLEDLNPLDSQTEEWKTKATTLVESLIENDRKQEAELDKLKRENFGMKATITNLRAKVEKYWRYP